MDSTPRTRYSSDVTEDEWAFVLPYVTLMREDAPQRHHDLREIYNALRWMVSAGAPWRMLPTNFPPWEAVYQQTDRWLKAGAFEAMVHDLRALLRWTEGRTITPRRSFSIAARCRARRKAARGPATTGPNARTARNCTWRSIRWGTS